MGRKWQNVKDALKAERKQLVWILLTYVPAVFVAGYGGYAVMKTYALAFIVGGVYMIALLFVWGRILMAVRED